MFIGRQKPKRWELSWENREWMWKKRGRVEQQRRRMGRENGEQGGRGERKVAWHPAAYPWTLWGGLSFPLLPSFSFSFSFTYTHTCTRTVPGWHMRVLLQLNRPSMEPRLREREREGATTPRCMNTTPGRQRWGGRKGSEGGSIVTERTEVKWCDNGVNDGENRRQIHSYTGYSC